MPKKHKIQYSGCKVRLIWECYISIGFKSLIFFFVSVLYLEVLYDNGFKLELGLAPNEQPIIVYDLAQCEF